ncbi:MAG TPA: DUF2970 domain-containing protein [Macromonas sp.]|nr:DUF2970 domain-containing protein [Macromonas sp.]
MAPPPRKMSWLATVRAVLWGFLGVRRRTGFQQDTASLKPLPLLVTGVVLAFLFVLGLMALVHWVVQ